MDQLSQFEALSERFEVELKGMHFPDVPKGLYEATQYPLSTGGKRIRPVLCLMANELFSPISKDSFLAAYALELFHNFTLVHDDIMDQAAIRRGRASVHEKFGEATALLSGDTMFVYAYENLARIERKYLHRSVLIFNDAARKVCEGQYLDMEYEHADIVTIDQYIEMIALKTSVLLATSLKMGALLGGAGIGNQESLYEFGKNLGIAFQIQDDYLDAFGDPARFGKKIGGDIMTNKKTFLLIHALNAAHGDEKVTLQKLLSRTDEGKIKPLIQFFEDCGAKDSATALKTTYFDKAMKHLEEVAVVSGRKDPLKKLAHFLMEREV